MSRTVLRFLRDAANQRDRYRRYASRRDVWGRGLTKNPILVGMAGEWGVCEWLGRRGFPRFVDTSLLEHGDGGQDVSVVGLRLQVKTRRKNLGKRSLVRRVDRGRLVPLKCDLFVFAQWTESEPPEPVQLLGWAWAKSLRGCAFERSPIVGAQHWNLRVLDMDLEPMNRLVDELSARRMSA